MKESSERNSSREFLDAFQPEFLQSKPTAGQEDFCNEVNIELLPIKSNCQNSADFKVENPRESRDPPRFFWPSGSFASFRNDKLTMRQKVAEAEGWWVGQRRRVNGVEEALINDRSTPFLLFLQPCSPFPPPCPVLFLVLMIKDHSIPCSAPLPHQPYPCNSIRWRLSHVVYIANDGVYLYRK